MKGLAQERYAAPPELEQIGSPPGFQTQRRAWWAKFSGQMGSTNAQLNLIAEGIEIHRRFCAWHSVVELLAKGKALIRERELRSQEDSVAAARFWEASGDVGYDLGYANKDTQTRKQTYQNWMQALSLYPRSHARIPAVHRKLGMVCRILRLTEEANFHFRQAESRLHQASKIEQLRFYQYHARYLYKTLKSSDPNDPRVMAPLAKAKSRISAAQKMIDAGIDEIQPEDSVIQLLFEADLYRIFYSREPFVRRELKKASDIIQRSGIIQYIYWSIYYNLGNFSQGQGEYRDAISYHRLAGKTLEKYPSNSGLFRGIYGSIAESYGELQEYELKLIYYQRAAEIAKQTFEQDTTSLSARKYFALSLNNMAYALEEIPDTNQALTKKYLKAALYHYEQLPPAPNLNSTTGQVLLNLGTRELDEGNFQGSIGYLVRAVEYLSEDLSQNQFHLARNYSELARAYVANGETTLADEALQRSETFMDTALSPLETARILVIQADYLENSSNFAEALQKYQRALWLLRGLVTMDNPAEEVQLTQLLDRRLGLLALEGKARALKKLALLQQDREGLLRSLKAHQQSIALTHLIRQVQTAQSSKVELIRQYRSIFESGLDLAYYLFESTQDSTYLNEAFAFMEQSRGMVLLAAVSTSEAATSAGVPQDILLQQRELQARSDSLLRQLSQAAPAEISTINKSLVEVSAEQDALRKELEQKYPKYYQQIYETGTVGLREIQQDLQSSQQVVLEYFYGDSLLFTFAIGADTVIFKRQAISPEFEAALASTQQIQVNRNVRGYANEYASASYTVYQSLIGHLGIELPEKLLLIGDDRLNFVSFEALVTRPIPPEQQLHFNFLHYLIDDHILAYDYSYTIRKRRQRYTPSGQTGMLAMAPAFRADSNARSPQLPDLPFARAGILDLSEMLQGVDPIVGDGATETMFRNQASRYAIIDLATHGMMDSTNSVDCRLFFKPDSLNDGMLHLGELYSLELNARLAVLEACESGMGPNARGEGIMSMARGFSYAGCKTIVTSLWNVAEEEITFQIMQDFYHYLAEGKAVDEALTQAKRDFLARDRQSPGARAPLYKPFYWAEMIVIGDTSPVSIREQNRFQPENLGYFLALALGALALIFLTRIRKRIKTHS